MSMNDHAEQAQLDSTRTILNMRRDLEMATQLVREAGLDAGGATTCVGLVRVMLMHYDEGIEIERQECARANVATKGMENWKKTAQAKDAQIAELRARLDHLTRRRCCTTEPPRENGRFLVSESNGYPLRVLGYAVKFGWASPVGAGLVWTPIPGGGDD